MENIPSREQVAELLLSSGLDQQQIGLILDPMEQNSEIAEQSSKKAEDKMDRVLEMVTGLSQRLTRLEKALPIEDQAPPPARSTTESRTLWATDSSEMNYQDAASQILGGHRTTSSSGGSVREHRFTPQDLRQSTTRTFPGAQSGPYEMPQTGQSPEGEHLQGDQGQRRHAGEGTDSVPRCHSPTFHTFSKVQMGET